MEQLAAVVSPLALEDYHEAFRVPTVVHHNKWWLLVRAKDQAREKCLA